MARTHSLGGMSTGLLWGWGRNNAGQIGDKSRTDKSSPVALSGDRSFDKITAGTASSYGIDASTGLAYAWGTNLYGALGTNNGTSYSSPVAVAGGRSFDKFNANGNFCLVIDASTGFAYSWGKNGGNLGINTTDNCSSPTLVVGNRSFKEVACAGNSGLWLNASDGLAYASGRNDYGQLGTNNLTSYSSPVAVAGGRSFDEIAGGGEYFLARNASNGTLWGWGQNTYGQVGDASRTNRSSPVAVSGARSFDEIACGSDSSLARDASTGLLWAWGRNDYGQLGTNNATSYSSPVAVAGGRSFDEIVAGEASFLARDASTGLIYAWGLNNYGNLGTNDKVSYSSPVAIAGNRSFAFLKTLVFVPATGRLKVRVGGAWVLKPVKVRIGGAWVEKPVKVFKGGVWI